MCLIPAPPNDQFYKSASATAVNSIYTDINMWCILQGVLVVHTYTRNAHTYTHMYTQAHM